MSGLMRALTALSTSGPLASRAFIPLFVVTALSNPAVRQVLPDWFTEKLWILPESMTWLGHPVCVITVGVLALIEFAADKNDDLKEILEQAHVLLKGGVAILVALAVIPAETGMLVPESPVGEPAAAGIGNMTWEWLVLIATVGLTVVLAKLRADFFSAWLDVDDEDDFNLRKIVSLLEDLWAVVAIPMIVLLPPLTVLLVLVLLALAFTGKWLMRKLEERRRRPCSECGQSIMPTASRCPKCEAAQPVAELLTWNIFLNRRILCAGPPERPDLDQHELRLISRQRCAACAERIDINTFAADGCPKCGFEMPHEEWYNEYRDAVVSRAMWLLVPLMLISWIPVVGIAFAIVAIKLFLSAPLKVFIGRFQKFGLKWGMRLFTVLLLIAGSLPFVSIAAVPVLIIVHVLVYGHFAKKSIQKGLVGAQSAAT